MYEIEYTYSEKSAFSANLIAEKMLAQINEEVNRHVLMDDITDHRFDEVAVKSQDAIVITSSGTKCRRQTLKGVSICIKWRGGNTT